MKMILTIKCQCCPHIETSQLICFGNQLTGFYMRATVEFNGLISFSLQLKMLQWKCCLDVGARVIIYDKTEIRLFGKYFVLCE